EASNYYMPDFSESGGLLQTEMEDKENLRCWIRYPEGKIVILGAGLYTEISLRRRKRGLTHGSMGDGDGIRAGDLEEYDTGDNLGSLEHLLRVVPVIGILSDRNAFIPTPNAGEVDEVFDAPLEMFLKDENHKSEEIDWLGKNLLIHYFDYETGCKKYMIWGLTAGILIRAASIVYQRTPAFLEQTPKVKLPGVNLRLVQDGCALCSFYYMFGISRNDSMIVIN
ncbi:hypothetical protein M8C21_023178, partial [Ambrosia artemisiifolia]